MSQICDLHWGMDSACVVSWIPIFTWLGFVRRRRALGVHGQVAIKISGKGAFSSLFYGCGMCVNILSVTVLLRFVVHHQNNTTSSININGLLSTSKPASSTSKGSDKVPLMTADCRQPKQGLSILITLPATREGFVDQAYG